MAGKLKTNEVILQSPNGLQEATLSLSDNGIVSSNKKVNLASDTTFNSLPMFACRAWVKFNGNGTILSSGNISSIERTSTGTYRVYFINPMPHENYAVVTGFQRVNTNEFVQSYYNTTTYMNVQYYSNGSTTNAENISIAVFC